MERFTFRFELVGQIDQTRCMIYENYKDSKRPFYRLSGYGGTQTMALENLRERINDKASGLIAEYVRDMTAAIDKFKETAVLEV